MNLSILKRGIGPCIALFMAVSAYATPFSVSFVYSGTGNFVSGETASGNGSFTVNGTSLTAFSFTDTLTSGANSETYTYGLADVFSSSIAPGATDLSNLVLQITTNSVGAASPFGPTSFTFSYSAANPGSGATLGSASHLEQLTSGTVTLSPAATTPEPSSVVLLGLGLIAIGGVGVGKRRKQPAAK